MGRRYGCGYNCSCDNCSCKQQVKAKCVFVSTSDTMSCIGVTKGDDLDTALKAINDTICDLVPPSGYIYTGEEGQITVSEDNVIGLDVEITTELTNLRNDVTTLQTCCDDSVKSITSSTLLVTEPTSGNYVINYTPSPTPTNQKQGIIDNYVTSVSNVGSGYSYSKNFSAYSLNNGDEIRIKFLLKRTSGDTDSNNVSVISTAFPLLGMSLTEAGGLALSLFNQIITYGVIVLTVTDKTNNKMNGYINMYSSASNSGDSYDAYPSNFYPRTTFKNDITISLSDVNVIFNNTDTPTLEQFTVEIIRKV